MARRDDVGLFNGNPLVTADKITAEHGAAADGVMTLRGVALKTLVLIALVVGAGAFTWNAFFDAVGSFDLSAVKSVPVKPGAKETKLVVEAPDPATGVVQHQPLPSFDLSRVSRYMWLGIIVGLVSGMVIIFNRRAAPFLAPIYAIAEGLAIGGVSALYEIQFQGIVLQAAALTLAVFLAMLIAYVLGAVKATPNLVLGVTAILGGILLLYLADLGLLLFGGYKISLIHGTGWVAIGFSVFVCLMAAVCFIIDFDEIENAVEAGAPKYMEWYCGWGLLVTLLWLYLEILRLLAKLKSKD